MSLVPKHLLCRKNKFIRHLTAANSSFLEITHKVSTWVKIGLQWFKVNLLVANSLSVPVILGTDFLSFHNMSLDFGKKRISWNEGYTCFTTRSSVNCDSREEMLSLSKHEKAQPLLKSIVKNVKCFKKQDHIVTHENITNDHLTFAVTDIEAGRPISSPTSFYILPSQAINIMLLCPPGYADNTYVLCEVYDGFADKFDILCPRVVDKIKDQRIMIQLINMTNGKVEIPANQKLVTCFPLEGESEGISVNSLQEVENSSDESSWLNKVSLENSDLNPEEKKIFLDMLKKHRKAFALSMKEIGRTDIIKHVIDTGDSKLVYVRPRRYNEQDQKIIDEQVKEMLEADIIKPSISPYNAPILLVKKGEKVRLCLDYRELNKVTKFQTFPFPTS